LVGSSLRQAMRTRHAARRSRINGLVDIWFTFRDHRAALFRFQKEQAVSAASKITQFIKEIEGQLGWTTHLSWESAATDQRELDGRTKRTTYFQNSVGRNAKRARHRGQTERNLSIQSFPPGASSPRLRT
jgi:hypothetical protein